MPRTCSVPHCVAVRPIAVAWLFLGSPVPGQFCQAHLPEISPPACACLDFITSCGQVNLVNLVERLLHRSAWVRLAGVFEGWWRSAVALRAARNRLEQKMAAVSLLDSGGSGSVEQVERLRFDYEVSLLELAGRVEAAERRGAVAEAAVAAELKLASKVAAELEAVALQQLEQLDVEALQQLEVADRLNTELKGAFLTGGAPAEISE